MFHVNHRVFVELELQKTDSSHYHLAASGVWRLCWGWTERAQEEAGVDTMHSGGVVFEKGQGLGGCKRVCKGTRLMMSLGFL